MEVDLRSGDPAALRSLEKQLRQAAHDAAAEENTRWHSQALTVAIDTVGQRPAARIATTAPIVQAAISVSKALNFPVSFSEGSTDANFPMSVGIPSLTIDSGGRVARVHTTDESFESADAWKGAQRAVLLSVVLAQP